MYETPRIDRLGTIAELTKAFGDSGEQDVIYAPDGKTVYGSGTGSTDHIIVPLP